MAFVISRPKIRHGISRPKIRHGISRQRLFVNKRKLKIMWTCSPYVHHEHRWKWTAWLCGKWQKFWMGKWKLKNEI